MVIDTPKQQDTAMSIEFQSPDPAVHALCIKIANRCACIIQAVLRSEERTLAVHAFYRVCREELDKPPGREPEV